MKLKPVALYDVSVILGDAELSCYLVTPPTVEALAAVAEEQDDTPREIKEALAFFREIELPAEDEDEAITEITIAGTVAGSIRVVPLQAYRQPAKRKKSADADSAATDTEDTEE